MVGGVALCPQQKRNVVLPCPERRLPRRWVVVAPANNRGRLSLPECTWYGAIQQQVKVTKSQAKGRQHLVRELDFALGHRPVAQLRIVFRQKQYMEVHIRTCR